MIAVTVDAVVFTASTDGFGLLYKVLMVRRKNEPFQGLLALPGGFLEPNEDLMDGALRELREETTLKLDFMRQFHTFGTPGRDPRGPTVSVVYVAEISSEHPVKGKDDALEAVWFPIFDLLSIPVAFDHRAIITQALMNTGTSQVPIAKAL